MTDEIKTDAEKVLADTKAEIDKLGAEEQTAVGYVKTHIAWVIGLGCFLAGVVVGHFSHFPHP